MKCLLSLINLIYFISISALADTQSVQFTAIQKKLAILEKSFAGKIGVYAIDTNSHQIIAYHSDERFPRTKHYEINWSCYIIETKSKQ